MKCGRRRRQFTGDSAIQLTHLGSQCAPLSRTAAIGCRSGTDGCPLSQFRCQGICPRHDQPAHLSVTATPIPCVTFQSPVSYLIFLPLRAGLHQIVLTVASILVFSMSNGAAYHFFLHSCAAHFYVWPMQPAS
ncbi:L-alanine exporter AlaE, partial [Salmonella enterica]|uniref:L-alanine exporter AlaE n=1 Tax=Salmonella enterica TaxID=28901 RepID=UPI00398C4D3E